VTGVWRARTVLAAVLPRLLVPGLLVLGLLVLGGCGKKGAPSPPGPQDQVTWPRIYPTH